MLLFKYFKKSENIWQIFWENQTNQMISSLLEFDQNTIIVASIDGIIEKFIEEKSSIELVSVTKKFP